MFDFLGRYVYSCEASASRYFSQNIKLLSNIIWEERSGSPGRVLDLESKGH